MGIEMNNTMLMDGLLVLSEICLIDIQQSLRSNPPLSYTHNQAHNRETYHILTKHAKPSCASICRSYIVADMTPWTSALATTPKPAGTAE